MELKMKKYNHNQNNNPFIYIYKIYYKNEENNFKNMYYYEQKFQKKMMIHAKNKY